MAKEVKQLDRVIIRFAGDSGDGMQLTGDRFTQESAAFGNDLHDPAELPRRDPGAPGHPARASRRSRCTSPTTTSSPPGDSPDVLVAMNPAALKSNLPDMKPGTSIIVDSHDFTEPQPDQGRVRRQPARGRLARRLRGQRRRPHRDDRRGGQGVRALPQGRRPGQEHVRPRACCRGCTAGPRRPPPRSWRSGSPRRPTSATPTSRRSRRAGTSARPPRRSRSSTRSSRRRCRPGIYRNITGNLALAYGLVAGSRAVGPADLPGHLPDHAGLRHPARAEQAQAVRDHHVPGRGRDRRHRRGARRLVRRVARASPAPPAPASR